MKLAQLMQRLDEASTVMIPRLRAAGQDAMADALAFELHVIRTTAPGNPKFWHYHEGMIFGFAFAAGLVIAIAESTRRSD